MNKTKKKVWIILLAVLLVAALAAGGVAIYHTFFTEAPTASDGVVARISSDWDPGLEQEETASDNTGIQIPGYGTAVMKAGDTSLHLSIGNPKSNQCGFYATLKLEDGRVLYQSELLEPGYGLTEVPLSQTLEPGEYSAVVSYQCVTLEEEPKPLNSADSAFTLIVQE